jgi:hypothetical protein
MTLIRSGGTVSKLGPFLVGVSLSLGFGGLPLAGAQAKPYGPGTGSAAAHMSATAAMSCDVISPKHTVALVELFTSEGCSSCPPADRWLQNLPRNGYAFDKVVPLSLHVGYWDYIGWKDPYAQQRFTDRQRAYANLRQSNSVYTPQVVLAGSDFRSWDGASFKRELSAMAARPAAANIALSAAAVGSALQIKTEVAMATEAQTTQAATRQAATQLHLAIFEMGLKNKVTRGENSGETLTHDFVVRQWQGPALLEQGKLSSKQTLTLDAPSTGRALGVAAFVQGAKGEVLQATACVMQ